MVSISDCIPQVRLRFRLITGKTACPGYVSCFSGVANGSAPSVVLNPIHVFDGAILSIAGIL